jgi:hypothetical protein
MLTKSVSSLKNFFVKHKAQILEVGIGRTLYQTFNVLTDDIIWPLMIVWLGWKGSVIMSSFSLIQCAAFLIWYQRKGRDWLGIGIIEESRVAAQEGIENFAKMKVGGRKAIFLLIVKIFLALPAGCLWVSLWLMNKSPLLRFFGLGMIQDPFEVTAYFKKADFSSKHLTGRDWLIFLASWAWTNLYWNGRSWINALLILAGWKLVHH